MFIKYIWGDYMKILIFGTGKYYQEYKVFFQRVTIVAFLDNDKNKQGKRLDNILIIEPQEGIKKEHDKIFILSILSTVPSSATLSAS